FGLGGSDDFPNIDAHGVKNDLELVDQGDVHRAVSVLQNLARLSNAGTGNTDNATNDGLVEGGSQVGARLVNRAHNLGDGTGREVLIARIFALRTVGEKEVSAGNQAAFL